jgi:hypothetical protein
MIVRCLAVVALALAAPTARADLDPYLPADTESYLSVNVKQVLASNLVKKYGLDPAKKALKEMELNGLLQELGIDPFRDIDRVQIATPTTTERDRGLGILTGTFDVARLRKKADNAARDNDDSVKLHRFNLGGGAMQDVYEIAIPGQEQTMFVAVVGNKTLLASPGKDYVVEALKQARLRKKPALKNRGFQAVVEKIDPRQGVSVALLGSSFSKNEWLDLLPGNYRDAVSGIEVVGGGLAFGNEIKLELVISTKSDRAARDLRDVLTKGVRLAQTALAFLGQDNKIVGLLNEVLGTVRVGGRGKVLSVSGKLTADVLQDFQKDDT